MWQSMWQNSGDSFASWVLADEFNLEKSYVQMLIQTAMNISALLACLGSLQWFHDHRLVFSLM